MTRMLPIIGMLAASGLVACSGSPSQRSTAEPSPVSNTTASAAPAATTTAQRPPAARYAPKSYQGAYLPDHSRTPGALNSGVTQSTIHSTICVSGYTRTVRPPESYTTNLKAAQLASGYAIAGLTDLSSYEEDHLIPLELGGNPTDPRNLWPEPWERSSSHPNGFAAAGAGAQTKDRIEDSLHTRVCDGRLTLAYAQHLIASNWRAAFDTYIGGTTSTTATTTTLAPPPKTSSGVLTCSASMSNPTPNRYSYDDVIVRTGVAGAAVTTVAHYKSKDTIKTGTAGSNGIATISYYISGATAGYTVIVNVSVSAGGQSKSCSTSFTPQ